MYLERWYCVAAIVVAVVSQLKLAMVPVLAVRYCAQGIQFS